MQQNNLISQRNALEKDFQKWKQQRGEHLTTQIRDLEAKSLFYKFPQSSTSNSSFSFLKSPNKSATTIIHQQLSSAKHSFHKPIPLLQGSSLVNLHRTIIQDSLQNNEHLLNKLGQTHDFSSFIPYINERDKLGRLLKEDPQDLDNLLQKQLIDQDDEKIDTDSGQIDQVKRNNERSSLIVTPATFLSIAGENQIEKQTFSKVANRRLRDQHQRGKSLSEMQVLSPSSNQQIRSTSSLIQQKLKLSQLVGGASNIREAKSRVSSSASSLLNIDSSNKLRASSYFNHSNNSFLGKTSLFQESIHDKSQCKQKTHSFTQIISWNSQPPSPNKIPKTPQQQLNSNSNVIKSPNQNNIILESFKFDKNNQMKQVDIDFKNKISALNYQHMLSRTKKLQTSKHQKSSPSPLKNRKDIGLQRMPESVYQSQFFRMLFNHHKKIQDFNKMIDRNELNMKKDSKEGIDDRKIIEQQKQQQESGNGLELPEKAEENLQKLFKSRIQKSVNVKYQKEDERETNQKKISRI